MTEKNLNIYQRISAIQAEVKKIDKSATVSSGGGGSYAAVTHDDVTKMLRPLMVKHGVISRAIPITGSFNVVPTGVSWGKSGRELMQIRACFIIEYINIDNPDERIDMPVWAFADDIGDKGPGKVLSYAQKYADLKMFRLQTGEDDEARVNNDELRRQRVTLTDEEIATVFNEATDLFGDDAGDELRRLADKIFPYTEGDFTAIERKHMQTALIWLNQKHAAISEGDEK